MSEEYLEEEIEAEDTLSESQARNLVKWCIKHGHTKEEAYECLAYVLNACVD